MSNPFRSKGKLVQKILVTVAIGSLTFGIAERAIGGGPIAILASVVIGGVTLIAQFLLDVEQRLNSVEAQQHQHNEAAERMIQLNFSRISEVTETFSKVDSSAVPSPMAASLLGNIASVPSDITPLAARLARSEVQRLSDFLRQLGSGDATYDGEDRDWLMALTASAEKSMKATSLTVADSDGNANTDSGLWTSDLGQRYFDLQRDIVENGIHIERIFIVTKAEFAQVPEFIDVCHAHQALGANVKVLELDRLPVHIRSAVDDFIIFDDSLVYEMSTVSRMGPAEYPILTTRIIQDPVRVWRKLQLYRSLNDVATPFQQSPNH